MHDLLRRLAQQSGIGRDVDDGTFAAGQHVVGHRLGAVDDAVDIERQLPAAGFLRQKFERRLGGYAAGIVDQHIDRAEAFMRRLHHGVDALAVGDVGLDRDDRALQSLGLGVALDRLSDIHVARGVDDVAALAREFHQQTAADAARAAGDDNGFARKAEIHDVFPFVVFLNLRPSPSRFAGPSLSRATGGRFLRYAEAAFGGAGEGLYEHRAL